jgi:2-octaprenyl-6-methoxyphenol hydroxylase
VTRADDPVRGLDDAQRARAQHPVAARRRAHAGDQSPLKHFALGLNAERTLVEGATVRIGNAAQTLHPVAGQGLNLGLRDAHALVDALRFQPRRRQPRCAAWNGRAPPTAGR